MCFVHAGRKHSSRGDRDLRVNYFDLSLSFLVSEYFAYY